MKIIDCHTHFFPMEAYADPYQWAVQCGELHFAELMKHDAEQPSLQDWPTMERFVADMDDAQVNQVILLGWYWQKEQTCRLHNAWMGECMKKHPERFMAFASVQPNDAGVLDDLKRCYDLGFRGVGEVLPQVQGFQMRDKQWLKIVEWCIECGWPINMHVTDPVGPQYRGRVETPLADYFWLAQQYPELKLILAHWGGLLGVNELNGYSKKVLSNVYYDCAASALLYEMNVFERMAGIVGDDKILFGSDYPLKLYPKKPTADFSTFIQSIRVRGGLNHEQLDALFSKNIQRILGSKAL